MPAVSGARTNDETTLPVSVAEVLGKEWILDEDNQFLMSMASHPYKGTLARYSEECYPKLRIVTDGCSVQVSPKEREASNKGLTPGL